MCKYSPSSSKYQKPKEWPSLIKSITWNVLNFSFISLKLFSSRAEKLVNCKLFYLFFCWFWSSMSIFFFQFIIKQRYSISKFTSQRTNIDNIPTNRDFTLTCKQYLQNNIPSCKVLILTHRFLKYLQNL